MTGLRIHAYTSIMQEGCVSVQAYMMITISYSYIYVVVLMF